MKAGVTLKQAQSAKAKAAKVFGEIAGEVAVGIAPLSEGRYGLKVNLTESPAENVKFPSEIAGVPVQVEVVGKIKKR